jgi:hypothetical protein
MRILGALAGLAALMGGSVAANAVPINSPVPGNAYITFSGLNWAWGGPCSFTGSCGDGDLTYQSTQGWRLPTPSELGLIPSNFASYFVFPGANVPYLGADPVSGAFSANGVPPGDFACATPYFSTVHIHCDYVDGVDGFWAGTPAGDAHGVSQYGFPVPEQLYVRAAPEPISILIFGAGLIGLGAIGRRHKSQARA